MWIFTTFGFFSVVEDREDSARLIVRARVREDLANFTNRLRRLPVTIVSMPSADYPYRIVVDRSEFQDVVSGAIDDIDYDNFRNQVEATAGTARHVLYLEVWSVLCGLTQLAKSAAHRIDPASNIKAARRG